MIWYARGPDFGAVIDCNVLCCRPAGRRRAAAAAGIDHVVSGVRDASEPLVSAGIGVLHSIRRGDTYRLRQSTPRRHRAAGEHSGKADVGAVNSHSSSRLDGFAARARLRAQGFERRRAAKTRLRAAVLSPRGDHCARSFALTAGLGAAHGEGDQSMPMVCRSASRSESDREVDRVDSSYGRGRHRHGE
jgi:hypothetical protein